MSYTHTKLERDGGYNGNARTSTIVCLPYLDMDTTLPSPQAIAKAGRELAQRRGLREHDIWQEHGHRNQLAVRTAHAAMRQVPVERYYALVEFFEQQLAERRPNYTPEEIRAEYGEALDAFANGAKKYAMACAKASSKRQKLGH